MAIGHPLRSPAADGGTTNGTGGGTGLGTFGGGTLTTPGGAAVGTFQCVGRAGVVEEELEHSSVSSFWNSGEKENSKPSQNAEVSDPEYRLDRL